MAEVKVRELRGVEELERVVALQQAVWGFADRDIVPAALLIAAQEEGALIAGAFAQGELIGFVFGFPTRDPAQQHSHMLGVLEPYRGTGAALALKRFQRDWCLARGIARVVWTYDPLRGGNANFNVRKLGVTVRRYLPDCYGALRGVNAGAPSDRFWAEWELASPRVAARLSAPPPPADVRDVPFANRVDGDVPREAVLDLDAPRLLVRIPDDWGAILGRDPALALRWRLHAREVFGHYFARGYRVTEFVPRPNAYVLERIPVGEGG